MLDEIAAVLPVTPGTEIAGKYRIEKLLAAGGMGAVCTAHHMVLEQRVAIKFMLPELVKNQEAAQRFLREARAMAKLQSEYVARVTDVDMLPDGTPFMVMEYLEGSPLDARIKTGPPPAIPHAVDIALEALAGLASAHRAGIVHRDLKPSNLFITRTGSGQDRVKILDFGISKVVSDDESLQAGAVTSTQSVLGSPSYMAPEQIASAKDVNAQADLWSIGVILHELLTGERVFQGDTVGAILASILTEDAPLVTSRRAEVDPGLERVISTLLQRDRAQRYDTAYKVMAALGPYASQRVRSSLALSVDLPANADSIALDSTVQAPGAADEAKADLPPEPEAAPAPAPAPAPVAAVTDPGAATHAAAVVDTHATMAPNPQSKSRAALIAVAVATIVVAAGGGAMLYAGSDGSAATTASATPTATASESPAPSATAAPAATGTPSATATPTASATAAPTASASAAPAPKPVVKRGPLPGWKPPPTKPKPKPKPGGTDDLLGSRD